MTQVLQAIEVVYENGLLRPLNPLVGLSHQIYRVVILNATSASERSVQASLRGKYRGYLSSVDEFARQKQAEKAMEC